MIDLESDIHLPVFEDAGMKHERVTYVLIAATAHLGLDGSGHYQTLLKVQPVDLEGHSVRWLLTQDGQRPQPIWTPPKPFLQNLTIA